MRIENGNRAGTVAARSNDRSAARSGATFQVPVESAPARSASLAPSGPVTHLGALLALQAVDDATQAKKKQVRRGLSLLEALDELRVDLLTGRASEGRVNRLLALVGQARLRCDPEIDALLDEVEVRARVELAKLGHYPG